MSDILEEPVPKRTPCWRWMWCNDVNKIMNFTVPLWEITLENGKTVTETRYRFDLVPSFNPPHSANEHIISDDDDNDLVILCDCVMSQKGKTEVIKKINNTSSE